MQLFLGLALATVPSLIGQESRAIRNMEAMPAESVVSNLIEVGSPKVPSSFLIMFRVWGCWDLMPWPFPLEERKNPGPEDTDCHHTPDEVVYQHGDDTEQVSILWCVQWRIELQQIMALLSGPNNANDKRYEHVWTISQSWGMFIWGICKVVPPSYKLVYEPH